VGPSGISTVLVLSAAGVMAPAATAELLLAAVRGGWMS